MSVLSDIDLYTSVSVRPDGIDSRDLIKARDEAQELLDCDDEKIEEVKAENPQVEGFLSAEGDPELIAAEYDLLTDDERADLEAIIELVDELDGCAEDWSFGAHFVPDYRWQEYAEEYASDVYGYDRYSSNWPLSHIDWEAAADELAQDYTTVEIDGTTYYVR